jgi:exodeoxyribonuclease VII large subunit
VLREAADAGEAIEVRLAAGSLRAAVVHTREDEQ